ncbi:hypothetical protein BDR04DRAFT_882374 [Suillus decipiens]|nr:hypothetical protein BDR04DRAFT_882374 [Suillus decipiens]
MTILSPKIFHSRIFIQWADLSVAHFGSSRVRHPTKIDGLLTVAHILLLQSTTACLVVLRLILASPSRPRANLVLAQYLS